MNEEELRLRELRRQVEGLAGKAKDYPVRPTVPDSDVQELQKRIRDRGLASANLEYARPVLEVLASTADLSFDVNDGLPDVKGMNSPKAPEPPVVDEQKITWNA